MTPNYRIALILCVLSSTAYSHVSAYAGPFITNYTTILHVIQQPLSVNPERSEICHGTQAQCPNSLPLAQPKLTSVGILSAFEATGFSQANPNSPQPATSKTCAKWVWSGSDNKGWVCTAKPTPQPAQTTTQQTQQVAKCSGIINTFYCSADGHTGTIATANGQPACWLTGTNTAVLDDNGKTVICK